MITLEEACSKAKCEETYREAVNDHLIREGFVIGDHKDLKRITTDRTDCLFLDGFLESFAFKRGTHLFSLDRKTSDLFYKNLRKAYQLRSKKCYPTLGMFAILTPATIGLLIGTFAGKDVYPDSGLVLITGAIGITIGGILGYKILEKLVPSPFAGKYLKRAEKLIEKAIEKQSSELPYDYNILKRFE